jgi:hypothetical protein
MLAMSLMAIEWSGYGKKYFELFAMSLAACTLKGFSTN